MSSKNGKGLSGLYDRLSAEERFRLLIESQARSDETDATRLIDTCPKKHCRQNDPAFTGRWELAFRITLALSLELSRYLPRVQMVQATREIIPYARSVFEDEAVGAYLSGHEAGSRYAWRQAGMEGAPPGHRLEELPDGGLEINEDEQDPSVEASLEELESRLGQVDILPELLEKMERKLVEEAWPIWVAYGRFCSGELGLEPRRVLEALFESYIESVDGLERLVEELGVEAPREEEVEEYLALFHECWNKRFAPSTGS